MRSSSGGWVSNSRLNWDMLALVLVAGDGLLDPEVGGGLRARVHHRVVVPQLLERRDQARRVAGELDARHVGQRLAPAADGELHDWAMSGERISSAKPRMARIAPGAAAVAVVAVAAPAAPPHEADAEVGRRGR